MEQRMGQTLKIHRPHARLKVSNLSSSEIFLSYDHATFSVRNMPDGRWQRSLALSAYHWIRLSGAATTTPWEALRIVLTPRHRPALPMLSVPAMLLLATSSIPDIPTHRQLFRSVAWGFHELRPLLPVEAGLAGWEVLTPTTLDHLVCKSIEAMLLQHPRIPWPARDGTVIQMLWHLASELWRFPPDLVRQIIDVTAEQWTHPMYQEEGTLKVVHRTAADVWDDTLVAGILGMLSGLRLWERPLPIVRGLALGTSPLHLVPAWYQALVIMHPDAPLISDLQLAWLCDRTLGDQRAAPFEALVAGTTTVDSHTIQNIKVGVMSQETVDTRSMPSGQWEELISPAWPLLKAYDVQRMRVVATPNGCWMRLIPSDGSWGSVLWWRPNSEPPTCWALACNKPLLSPPVLALHETFWTLWRNLHITGRLHLDS